MWRWLFVCHQVKYFHQRDNGWTGRFCRYSCCGQLCFHQATLFLHQSCHRCFLLLKHDWQECCLLFRSPVATHHCHYKYILHWCQHNCQYGCLTYCWRIGLLFLSHHCLLFQQLCHIGQILSLPYIHLQSWLLLCHCLLCAFCWQWDMFGLQFWLWLKIKAGLLLQAYFLYFILNNVILLLKSNLFLLYHF